MNCEKYQDKSKSALDDVLLIGGGVSRDGVKVGVSKRSTTNLYSTM